MSPDRQTSTDHISTMKAYKHHNMIEEAITKQERAHSKNGPLNESELRKAFDVMRQPFFYWCQTCTLDLNTQCPSTRLCPSRLLIPTVLIVLDVCFSETLYKCLCVLPGFSGSGPSPSTHANHEPRKECKTGNNQVNHGNKKLLSSQTLCPKRHITIQKKYINKQTMEPTSQ